MSEQQIICPRCKAPSLPGTDYCLRCGEVLGPSIKAELQRLALILRDLDARIAAGKGSQTVADLREEYYSRYEDQRRAPWLRKAPPAAAAASEIIAPVPTAAPAPVRPPIAPEPAAVPLPTAAPATAAPAGPVFSWRAFAAEQAIAIMAYLGGFLALVATLTLVVSKGQNLPTLTLAVIALVYVSFGAAGFGLRRVERLRTVSRVYLAVFALMTPLVALALYRYELQALHVPVAGMLCISAVYATIVYLGLAVQTRFLTYAYLGWTALMVAALAIIPWTRIDLQWWVFDLGVVTLALLGPHHLRQRLRRLALAGAGRPHSRLRLARQRLRPRLGILAEPATQAAAMATIPVVIGVQALGIIGLTQTVVYGAFPTIQVQPWPLALGACILVPITAGWRLTVPSWRPNQQNAIIDTVDGFNAVFFAEAVGGTTLAIANLPLPLAVRPLAVSLAATALAEFGLALALHRWQRRRRMLFVFLEVFAVGLASGGALIVLGDPLPNWPLLTALSAALVVSLGAAIVDGAWWLLVSGFFLAADYYRVALLFLPADQVAAARATLFFALALASFLAALAAGLAARSRRFVAPLYVVALGTALYTLAFLPRHDAGYQTEILLVFTAAAFSAGLRERQPMYGSVVTGFFGVLATLPFAINDPNGLHISLLALGLALAALGARRLWGRVWALAPYAIALWAVIIAAIQTSIDGLSVPDWSASGLSFTAWFLLFFAVLAYGVALWENEPLATIVPAALALWALRLASSDIASVALIFVLVAVGAAARHWRGRWWGAGARAAGGAALEIAAVAGSVVVTVRLNNLGADAPTWQVAFLLALAVAAYLVAAQERQPILSALAVVYALAAVFLLPGPGNLLPTLVVTFALAALGAILRLLAGRAGFRRQWAYAPYAAAIGSSIFATMRVVPFNAGQVEGLLLIFAAVAYALVVLEGEPLAALLPMLYAVASIFVQPDAHALLPLALGFALLGLITGRVAGIRWSYAPYAAAAVAAGATAFIGQNDAPFEAIALLILAALAYVIAAVESRPDVLLVALVLGVLALGAGTNALHLPTWQATLAFAALGWLYMLGAALWTAIPWLHPTRAIWWAEALDPQDQDRWRDPRAVGALVHRVGGFLVVGGATFAAIFSPGAFSIQNPQTLAVAIALLALAGMIVVAARTGMLSLLARASTQTPAQRPWSRLALYLAGELAALAITWAARYLGADNVQAFVLAPGSYQLLVGAFLPADQRVPHARRVGQFASLTASLLLLLPTLYQTFTEPGLVAEFVYGSVVFIESLIIIGLGVGTRTRLLVLVGSAFIGIDALSSAALAIQKGVPIALVIGILALLLIGVATWLSLRTRREDSQA
jgi:hypothetical protein